MITDLDNVIKYCTKMCKSYAVERNQVTDSTAEFTLRFEIERVTGNRCPVVFEHLNEGDLIHNGFEVPQ